MAEDKAVLRLPRNQWLGPLKHVRKTSDLSRVYISVLVSDDRMEESRISFKKTGKIIYPLGHNESGRYFVYKLVDEISGIVLRRLEAKLSRNRFWRKVPISLSGIPAECIYATLPNITKSGHQ